VPHGHRSLRQAAQQTRVLLLVACLCSAAFSSTLALDASGVVYVSCGQDSTFGPDVAAGTTLVMQDCDSGPSGTGLTVTLSETSGGLSGLSIVVKNSNRVFVVVQADYNLNISDLSITMADCRRESDSQQH
jgi:hypothetical protein